MFIIKTNLIAHLQNFSLQILRQTRVRSLPDPDKLEEGLPLPLNRVRLANFLLQKIFQELEICDEASAQSSQQLEQEQDLRVLVQLEVLEQDLDDDFWFFPVCEVDAGTLSILFVVALLVPDGSKGVDEGVLVAQPVHVVFDLEN